MMYFEKEDILHLTISAGPEAGGVELSPNITVELDDNFTSRPISEKVYDSIRE